MTGPDPETVTLLLGTVALVSTSVTVLVCDQVRRRNRWLNAQLERLRRVEPEPRLAEAELVGQLANLAGRLSQHLVVSDGHVVFDAELWDVTGAPADIGLAHVNGVTVRLTSMAVVPTQRGGST